MGNVYSVYIGNEYGYNKGTHYLAVKFITHHPPFNKANCCIGITTEYNNKWIEDGFAMNSYHWPLVGAYSYFNGGKEAIRWYQKETVIIKLDLEKNMIWYYKFWILNGKAEKKLIKKEEIDGNERYYFMMVVCPGRCYEYTLSSCDVDSFILQ